MDLAEVFNILPLEVGNQQQAQFILAGEITQVKVRCASGNVLWEVFTMAMQCV